MKYKDIIIKNHDEYVYLLNALCKKADKIEIVLPDGNGKKDELIKKFQPFLIKEEKVQSWEGTITRGGKAIKYSYIPENVIYDTLREFENFFILSTNKHGDFTKYTELGTRDIAFFRNGKCLFYTTTHEGYAVVDEEFEGYIINYKRYGKYL